MNGGLFFKFIFDCWQSFTTLSISFHVLSSVFLSVDNFWGPHASEKAPCNFDSIDEIFFDCCMRVRLAAILTEHGEYIIYTLERHYITILPPSCCVVNLSLHTQSLSMGTHHTLFLLQQYNTRQLYMKTLELFFWFITQCTPKRKSIKT